MNTGDTFIDVSGPPASIDSLLDAMATGSPGARKISASIPFVLSRALPDDEMAWRCDTHATAITVDRRTTDSARITLTMVHDITYVDIAEPLSAKWPDLTFKTFTRTEGDSEMKTALFEQGQKLWGHTLPNPHHIEIEMLGDAVVTDYLNERTPEVTLAIQRFGTEPLAIVAKANANGWRFGPDPSGNMPFQCAFRRMADGTVTGLLREGDWMARLDDVLPDGTYATETTTTTAEMALAHPELTAQLGRKQT